LQAVLKNFRRQRSHAKPTMATSCELLLDRIERNAAKYPTKTAVTFLGSGPDGGKVEKARISGPQAEAERDGVSSSGGGN
jgi:hypothetical protein